MKKPAIFFVIGLVILVAAAVFYFYWSAKQLVAENDVCSGSLKGKTILLTGDSLAIGLGEHLNFWAKENGGSFVMDAVGGTTIDYWAGERIKSALKRAESETNQYPAIVFVSLGTNDVAQHLTDNADIMGRRIEDLLVEVRSGTEIIWIGPPRWPTSDWEITDTSISKNVILNNLDDRTKYFDSRLIDLNNTNRNDGDGHPAPAGYDFWAKAIWRWCGGLK